MVSAMKSEVATTASAATARTTGARDMKASTGLERSVSEYGEAPGTRARRGAPGLLGRGTASGALPGTAERVDLGRGGVSRGVSGRL
ncbi:hypothetical protein GCM10017673_41480 [Streptosporangium violaceochromogenes]|nr:hypothetical protein GCM10017673_41480 [Streptosporangium violaceochromogenes]